MQNQDIWKGHLKYRAHVLCGLMFFHEIIWNRIYRKQEAEIGMVQSKNCALAIFVFIFGLFLLGNVTVVSAIKMLVVILLNFA